MSAVYLNGFNAIFDLYTAKAKCERALAQTLQKIMLLDLTYHIDTHATIYG